MTRLALALLLVLPLVWGCRGPYVEQCNPQTTETAFTSLDFIRERVPELEVVIDWMEVSCREDTSGLSTCRKDHDACTVRLGRPGFPGLTIIRDDVAVNNALGHESLHWSLWDTSTACASHQRECGWSWDSVDERTWKP